MKITSQNVLTDYAALRRAASAGQTEAEISLNGMPVEILSSHVDNDPVTPDHVRVSAWSGDFSAQPADLSFSERQQDGKQVLEFVAEQATSIFSSDKVVSKAIIDMQNGELLTAFGSGNFLVSDVQAPPAPVKPDPTEAKHAQVQSNYILIQQALADGKKEFYIGMNEYQVIERGKGYAELSSWDGSMSSGQVKETYREYTSEDGKAMLEYTRFTPAVGFVVGSKDETVTYNLPMLF